MRLEVNSSEEQARLYEAYCNATAKEYFEARMAWLVARGSVCAGCHIDWNEQCECEPIATKRHKQSKN